MSELLQLNDPPLKNGKIPVISVLMSVYNGEKYLAEAIESILNQTFSDFELLALDDGSTDESLKLLREYASRDSRLHVIAREHRGFGSTENELVKYARGEFIAKMDQDDISLPNRFELQVAYLKKYPKVVVVGGANQLIDSAGRYLTTLLPPQTDVEIQALILRGHSAITHPSVMMRSAMIKSVGGYNEQYIIAGDLDLWLRLGELGELANLKEVVFKYRLHAKSISENAGEKQREAARTVCENAWRRRNVAGVFTAEALWRPGPDRASRHTFMLKYGWWAWNSRQRKTAVYYGWQAIKVKPFSIDSWKLLMVSLLKPLKIA
jgi:glycosyltransferase involved in cell wall biosynthesis